MDSEVFSGDGDSISCWWGWGNVLLLVAFLADGGMMFPTTVPASEFGRAVSTAVGRHNCNTALPC